MNSPERCQIPCLQSAARDVVIRAKKVKEAHPGIKLFIHGHSMGGLLTALIACNEKQLMDGIIFSAAAFEIHPDTAQWWKVLGAKVLNWIMPNLKVGGVSFDGLSRKESVTVVYSFCLYSINYTNKLIMKTEYSTYEKSAKRENEFGH